MIEFLSKWIEQIAVAVIIASIFEMIVPNGNLKKYIKIILGIYVIFAIISPFTNSNDLYAIDIEEEIDKYSKNVNTSDIKNEQARNMNQIYITAFEKEIKQTVQKKGYGVHNCIVKGLFDIENENIEIKEIRIILDSKKIANNQENAEEEDAQNNLGNIIKIEKIEEVKINGAYNSIENKNTESLDEITSKNINELKQFLSEKYELDINIIDINVR